MGFIVLIGEAVSVIKSPNGFDWMQMIGLYVGVPFYLFLYIVYKYYWGTRIVPLMECDLVSGISTSRDDEIKLDTNGSRLSSIRRRIEHFFNQE